MGATFKVGYVLVKRLYKLQFMEYSGLANCCYNTFCTKPSFPSCTTHYAHTWGGACAHTAGPSWEFNHKPVRTSCHFLWGVQFISIKNMYYGARGFQYMPCILATGRVCAVRTSCGILRPTFDMETPSFGV